MRLKLDSIFDFFSRASVKGRAATALIALAALGCSTPHPDAATPLGKAALIDEVNLLLTDKKCPEAIALIEPAYQSADTDNDIRMLRAAAWGCAAGVDDFLGLLMKLPGEKLGTESGEGSHFWRTLAKLFYLKRDDGTADTNGLSDQIQAAWNAMDALAASTKSDAIVADSDRINGKTLNPGSTNTDDRLDDANLYMFMVSLSLIGSIEGRYGAPDPTTFKKGQKLGYASSSRPLGWNDPTKIDKYACSYVSGIMNMFDSLGSVVANMSDKLSGSLGPVRNIASVLDLACDFGCVACGKPAGSCNPCPSSLKDRNSCVAGTTPATSNDEACAAAGIITFINDNSNVVGWVGP